MESAREDKQVVARQLVQSAVEIAVVDEPAGFVDDQ